MALPQSQEYNEAIQAPTLCFTDPELKRGAVRTNAMGLPVAVSGGFANVYEVAVPGAGSWAVRCFIREVQDQQRRYTEISNALAALKLQYTVHFQYQHHGIRVNGRLLPIVKMEWLRGSQLGDYVQKNVKDGRLMRSLAEKWVTMVEALRGGTLAHGDLQHGNVLVVNHELKLIDYDGIYVKAFHGMRSNEVGHPNYQHPQRTENDFGLYTDNFSSWVIYASLRILSIAPETLDLARELGRDECLLFNKEDFANPAMSPLLGTLKFHENATVTRLAAQIEHLLSVSPRDVPPLDASLYRDGEEIVSTPVTAASDWWKTPVQEKEEPKPSDVGGSEVQTEEQVQFTMNPRAEKEVFIIMFGSVVGYFLLSGSIGVAGYCLVQIAIFLGMQLRLRSLYLKCPEAQQRERFFLEVITKDERLAQQTRRRDELKESLPKLNARVSTLTRNIQKLRTEATLKQAAEIKELHTAGAIARSEIDKRIGRLADEESKEIVAAVGQTEKEIATVQTRVKEMDVQNARLLREALEQHQKTSLRPLLAQEFIVHASISGIGSAYKATLAAYGIVTAADIEYGAVRRIRGFGPARTDELMKWKERMVARHARQIPTALPFADTQRIEARFKAPRIEAAATLAQAQQRVQLARQRVTQNYAAKRAALQLEATSAALETQKRLEEVNLKYSNKSKQRQQEVEHAKGGLEKEIATSIRTQTNLEVEIRNLQQWRTGTAARLKPYENINFEKFVRFVFLAPFRLRKSS